MKAFPSPILATLFIMMSAAACTPARATPAQPSAASMATVTISTPAPPPTKEGQGGSPAPGGAEGSPAPIGTPSPENFATVPPTGVPVTGSPEIPTEESSKIPEASATATENAKGELPDWARPYFADEVPEGAVDGTKLTDDQLRKMGLTATSNIWIKCNIPNAYKEQEADGKLITGFRIDLNQPKDVCRFNNPTDVGVNDYFVKNFPSATPEKIAQLKKRHLALVEAMKNIFANGQDRYIKANYKYYLQTNGDTIDWLVFTNPYPGIKGQFVGVLDIPLPDVAATETPLSTATAGATETQKAAETAPCLPSWLQGWFFEEPPEGSVSYASDKIRSVKGITGPGKVYVQCPMAYTKRTYNTANSRATVWGLDKRPNGETCVVYPKTDKDVNDFIDLNFKNISPERKVELVERYKALAQAFWDAFPDGKEYYFDASTMFMLQNNENTVDWCVFRTDGILSHGKFIQILNIPLPQK